MRLVMKMKRSIRSIDDFTLAFTLGLLSYLVNGITPEIVIHSQQDQWVAANAVLAAFYIVIFYIIIWTARHVLVSGKKE